MSWYFQLNYVNWKKISSLQSITIYVEPISLDLGHDIILWETHIAQNFICANFKTMTLIIENQSIYTRKKTQLASKNKDTCMV